MPLERRVRISSEVTIGGPLPVMIMGPCVIESRAHVLKMARLVAAKAAAAGLPCIFKASFDKANRSSHRSYRGPGLPTGLQWLAEVKERTGLPVTTDLHSIEQVEAVAAVVDLLQIPAFLCRQTDLIAAAAATGVATSIKKGQFMAPWDVKPLLAKFEQAGGRKLILIERGTTFGYNNLVTDFRALPIMRSFAVPVIFDATHSVQMPGGQGETSGGQGHFAPALIRAALAVGVEGIFLETHDRPAKAKSDGPNMLPTNKLTAVLDEVRRLHEALGRPQPARPFA